MPHGHDEDAHGHGASKEAMRDARVDLAFPGRVRGPAHPPQRVPPRQGSRPVEVQDEHQPGSEKCEYLAYRERMQALKEEKKKA